jgi:hypothetical protein
MFFGTHLCSASLRRTHHCTTTSLVRTIDVRTNDVANSKSGFPCFWNCTTHDAAIVVPPHNDDSDPSSAE